MKVFIGIVFCFISGIVNANEIVPDEVIKETLSLLTSGKVGESFDYVTSGNHYFSEKKSKLNETKSDFESFISQIGVPSSCEKLASKTLIKRYRKDIYFCLSDRQPFEIQFRFYKEKKVWRIDSFSYSSVAEEWLDKLVLEELSNKH